jgi:hypothetical protein
MLWQLCAAGGKRVSLLFSVLAPARAGRVAFGLGICSSLLVTGLRGGAGDVRVPGMAAEGLGRQQAVVPGLRDEFRPGGPVEA